jgi:uncharacterized protein (DUF111 family)
MESEDNFVNTLSSDILNKYSSLTCDGLFNITTTTGSDTYETASYKMDKRLNKLELDIKMLRLKLLYLEKKFTKDEVTNIRKMLMSEDEASRTLAESIIENA